MEPLLENLRSDMSHLGGIGKHGESLVNGSLGHESLGTSLGNHRIQVVGLFEKKENGGDVPKESVKPEWLSQLPSSKVGDTGTGGTSPNVSDSSSMTNSEISSLTSNGTSDTLMSTIGTDDTTKIEPFPKDLLRKKLISTRQKPKQTGRITKKVSKKPELTPKAKFIQKHTQRIRKNRIEFDDCDRISIEGTSYAVTRGGSVLVPLTLWKMTSTAPIKWNDKIYSRAENGNLFNEIKHEQEICKSYCRTGLCFDGEMCLKIHDPKRVRICSHFMTKGCNTDNCSFSHSPNVWNTPTCRFGRECTNNNCKFLHKFPEHSDNKEFEIWSCRPFSIKGHCERGTKCPFYHYFNCPDFSEDNVCKRRCGLYHLPSKVTMERSLGQSPSLALINSYTVLPHKLFTEPDEEPDFDLLNQYILDLQSLDNEINELDNDTILIE